jgi:hypothetical protein
MAIYLSSLESHATNVGLVLSLQTDMVSLAFHVKYDDQFLTVREPYGKYITKSQWQTKCGFHKENDKEPWVKSGEYATDQITPELPEVQNDIEIAHEISDEAEICMPPNVTTQEPQPEGDIDL